MSDYITLIGTEDVNRAAMTMQASADTIQRAASQMEYALMKHAEQMEEIVGRLEAAIAARQQPGEQP
jgi:hypothetical protein